jgi:exosortase
VNPTRAGRHDRLAAWLVLASLAAAYIPVLVRLARQWLHDENASHGLIVAPLAVWLIWTTRDRWRAANVAPSQLGLVVLFGSLAVYAAGMLGAELFLARVSLVGVAAGAVLYIWGWRHLRLIVFPLALFALAVPLPAILLNQVTFPLQLVASRVGEAAISAGGIPVLREGNVLMLANTTLEVAEACSGIRSLVSLVTLAVVAAYFRGGRMAGGVALVLLAVPIAVAANAARVAGTGIAAHFWGTRAAEGFFHMFSGWLVFGVAAALMVLSERLIVIVERRMARRTAPDAKTLEVSCAPAP